MCSTLYSINESMSYFLFVYSLNFDNCIRKVKIIHDKLYMIGGVKSRKNKKSKYNGGFIFLCYSLQVQKKRRVLIDCD